MHRSFAIASLAAFSFLIAPAAANPTDDVKAAMARFAALTSYEMTPSGKQTGTLDFVKPNRTHMTSNGMELIWVPEGIYIKSGSAKWTKVPTQFKGTMRVPTFDLNDRVRGMAASPDQVEVQDLGIKTIDGEALHAYSVKGAGSSPTSTIYLTSDGQLRRMEDSGDPSTAVTFSKFNEIAPINPPI